jgi:hypothetical protein
MSTDLDSYKTVPERITEFARKHPEGSLTRVGELQFVSYAGATWVIYTAAAYRTPDDQRPGIGTAWERIPGTTPYTKGSEVQNAETSAWGRAIVATLAADTRKGIASSEERHVGGPPARAWLEEARQLPTTEAVLALWREAKVKRAPVDVLDQISKLALARQQEEDTAAAPTAPEVMP